jgi:hypothetical protein
VKYEEVYLKDYVDVEKVAEIFVGTFMEKIATRYTICNVGRPRSKAYIYLASFAQMS